MKGTPCIGPSPRNTDTRARLSRAGRRTFLMPSDRYSVSSCLTRQYTLKCMFKLHNYTCCICTNSASMATKVPGLGSSSKRKHLCLMRLLFRLLRSRIVSRTGHLRSVGRTQISTYPDLRLKDQSHEVTERGPTSVDFHPLVLNRQQQEPSHRNE